MRPRALSEPFAGSFLRFSAFLDTSLTVFLLEIQDVDVILLRVQLPVLRFLLLAWESGSSAAGLEVPLLAWESGSSAAGLEVPLLAWESGCRCYPVESSAAGLEVPAAGLTWGSMKKLHCNDTGALSCLVPKFGAMSEAIRRPPVRRPAGKQANRGCHLCIRDWLLIFVRAFAFLGVRGYRIDYSWTRCNVSNPLFLPLWLAADPRLLLTLGSCWPSAPADPRFLHLLIQLCPWRFFKNIHPQ